jgi:hypothetical protein
MGPMALINSLGSNGQHANHYIAEAINRLLKCSLAFRNDEDLEKNYPA